MTMTLSTAARNAAANAVCGLLDGGTIEYQTSGSVVVATLGLAATAFGAAATGVATANAIANDTNAVGGTVAKAVFKNSGGSEVFNCSVTATGGGGDIEVDNVAIGAGTTVSLTSFTYTQPA